MRDLLTGLAILAIVALSAAAAAPWFVDWNAWRSQIEHRLKIALGRDVRIGGDISIRLLPSPRFTARQVTIEAAQAPAAATIDSLALELSLPALASGELRITEGTLERPIVTWKVAPGGDANPSNAAPAPAGNLSIEQLRVRGGEFWRIAADGRVLFKAAGDLDLEASQISGPWKAQGRIEVAGRRYDMRWNSGVMDANGRTAIKVVAQDPGLAFVSEADGALILDRQGWRAPPRFEGRVNASGVIPWPFGKTAGPQPWRMLAHGVGDAQGFKAQQIEFEAGPQDIGVKGEGEGELILENGPQARVALKVRPIDLDRILAIDPGQPPLSGDSVAELERFLTGAPFPIVFDAQIERAYARGESFGPIRVIGRHHAGEITVERFEAEAPGGVKGSATGRLWIDSEPALEARIDVSASQPAKAWQWISGASMEVAATSRFARAAHASTSGRLRWRPGRLAFDDGVISLDGARAQINAQRRFASPGDPGRIGLELKADRLDVDLLPPIAPFTAESPDVTLLISAKEVASATLGVSVGALELEAKQQAGVVTLSRFSLRQKGLSLTADGVVKDGVGRFAAELSADDLKPLAAALQRAAPGWWSDALAARAAALAPAQISASLQPSRDGKRWLAQLGGVAGGTRIVAAVDTKPRASDEPIQLDALRFNAQASDAGKLVRQLGWDAPPADRPGSISFALGVASGDASSFTLNATLAGTSIEASGGTASTITPALAGQLRIQSPDIVPALRLAKIGTSGGAPQPGWLESKLEIGAGGVRIENMKGDFAGRAIRSGAVQISFDQEARASGQIDVGYLTAADFTILAFGVDSMARDGGFWPSARFPTFTQWPFGFDLQLRAPRFDVGGGLSGRNAAWRVVSRADGVRIEGAATDIAGGKFSLGANIRREGALAALTGRVDAAGLDLKALGASGVSGALDLSVDVAGNGDAISRIVAGLSGAGSATLRNASVSSFDPAAAERVIAAHAKSETMPTFVLLTPQVERELARAPLQFDVVSAPATLANGVARIGPARLESKNAVANISTQIDLRSWTIDARGAVAGRDQSGDATPPIGFSYVGPLAAPKRSLDLAALFSDLTQKAAAREAARVEILEQDARERAAFNRRLRVDRERSEAERRAARPPEPPRAPPLLILPPPPPISAPILAP